MNGCSCRAASSNQSTPSATWMPRWVVPGHRRRRCDACVPPVTRASSLPIEQVIRGPSEWIGSCPDASPVMSSGPGFSLLPERPGGRPIPFPVRPHRTGCDGRPRGDDVSPVARGRPAGCGDRVGGCARGCACSSRSGYCCRGADRPSGSRRCFGHLAAGAAPSAVVAEPVRVSRPGWRRALITK